MRIKYRICQDEKIINIKEFIVDEKDGHKIATAMLHDEHFHLIAEQQYRTDTIARWMARGWEMKAKLRTPNLFPIAPYAEKIAESVMTLIREGRDRCIELFFDENDLVVSDF